MIVHITDRILPTCIYARVHTFVIDTSHLFGAVVISGALWFALDGGVAVVSRVARTDAVVALRVYTAR